jgi:hypothetical protein
MMSAGSRIRATPQLARHSRTRVRPVLWRASIKTDPESGQWNGGASPASLSVGRVSGTLDCQLEVVPVDVDLT